MACHPTPHPTSSSPSHSTSHPLSRFPHFLHYYLRSFHPFHIHFILYHFPAASGAPYPPCSFSGTPALRLTSLCIPHLPFSFPHTFPLSTTSCHCISLVPTPWTVPLLAHRHSDRVRSPGDYERSPKSSFRGNQPALIPRPVFKSLLQGTLLTPS